MRYYELDPTGKVKGSYAVPQPDKTLHALADAPDDKSKRDGVPGLNWIPDPELVAAAQKIEDNKFKVEIAKLDVKAAILTENADLIKWKIEEVVARIKWIETILGLR